MRENVEIMRKLCGNFLRKKLRKKIDPIEEDESKKLAAIIWEERENHLLQIWENEN